MYRAIESVTAPADEHDRSPGMAAIRRQAGIA